MTATPELLNRLLSLENPDNKQLGADFPVYKFHRLYEPRATLTDDEKRDHLWVENETQTGYYVLNPFFVSLVRDHRIWFSPAGHFNDPWDAGSAISILRSNKPIEKSVLRLLFDEADQSALAELADEYVYARIEERMREVLSILRFACFSRRFDSSPMWAHYADDHRGVCLEFRFMKKHPDGFFMMDPPFAGHHPVRYSDNFTQIANIENIGTAIYVLHTKHPDWAYEREIRFIKLGDPSHPGIGGTIPFSKSSLTKVILGYKVPPALWRAVEILIDHYEYEHTELVRAVFDSRTKHLGFLAKKRDPKGKTETT